MVTHLHESQGRGNDEGRLPDPDINGRVITLLVEWCHPAVLDLWPRVIGRRCEMGRKVGWSDGRKVGW